MLLHRQVEAFSSLDSRHCIFLRVSAVRRICCCDRAGVGHCSNSISTLCGTWTVAGCPRVMLLLLLPPIYDRLVLPLQLDPDELSNVWPVSGGVPLSVTTPVAISLCPHTHTHTEICIHNFFFSSKSLFLPFSLKRQYKALGNGASFLLRQDFLPIVLLEENESFPQVNSNNISVRRFPAALCMPLVPAMGDALPSWIEHSRSSRTATRVLLILGEVFKYYLYVCHPFT